jgi:protein-disulfide isomerase
VANTGRKGGGRAGRGTPQRRSSRTWFFALLGAIIVIGIGALVYVTTHPTADPAARSAGPPLPPGSAKGYPLGNPQAPVHIVEFADYECPACANYSVVTEPDVRSRIVDSGFANVTYFDFPLPMHKNTWWASHAAACAADQGKFWEMHDRIFAGQSDWNGLVTDDPVPILEGYAKGLGLNVGTWHSCVTNRVHQRDIEASKAEAERRHVQQTPTFYVGDRVFAGSVPYDQIRGAVDSARRAVPAGAHTP